MKRKRGDSVVPEMRERLNSNRSGKLTPSQWLDIVMQPFITVMLLIMPISFILLPRALRLLVRGGWLLLLIIVAFVVISFLLRAARYARAPLHFDEFTTEFDSLPPVWMFWRPIKLYDMQGRPMRFGKRLAPRPLLRPDRTYIVYYLREPDDHVLLSIAPADHPDAPDWQPDRFFEARAQRRQSS